MPTINTGGYNGQPFNIINATPIQSYNMNPQVVKSIGDKMQAESDANRDFYYNLENALYNIKVNDYDTDKAIKNSVMQEVDATIGAMVEKGEFFTLKNDLLKLANSIQRNEGLNRAIVSKAERDAFIKKLQEQPDWSDEDKFYWLHKIENEGQHNVRVNPETGLVEGGFNGYTLPKHVDINKKMQEVAAITKMFHADKTGFTKLGGYGHSMQTNIGGRTMTLTEYAAANHVTIEELKPELIENFIKNSLYNDSDVLNMIKAQVDLDLFKKGLDRDSITNNPIQEKNLKWKSHKLKEQDILEYVNPGWTEVSKALGIDVTPLSISSLDPKTEQALELERMNLRMLFGIETADELLATYGSSVQTHMMNQLVGNRRDDDALKHIAYIGAFHSSIDASARALGQGIGYRWEDSKITLTKGALGSLLSAQAKRDADNLDRVRANGDNYMLNGGVYNKQYTDIIEEVNNNKERLKPLKEDLARLNTQLRNAATESEKTEITEQINNISSKIDSIESENQLSLASMLDAIKNKVYKEGYKKGHAYDLGASNVQELLIEEFNSRYSVTDNIRKSLSNIGFSMNNPKQQQSIADAITTDVVKKISPKTMEGAVDAYLQNNRIDDAIDFIVKNYSTATSNAQNVLFALDMNKDILEQTILKGLNKDIIDYNKKNTSNPIYANTSQVNLVGSSAPNLVNMMGSMVNMVMANRALGAFYNSKGEPLNDLSLYLPDNEGLQGLLNSLRNGETNYDYKGNVNFAIADNGVMGMKQGSMLFSVSVGAKGTSTKPSQEQMIYIRIDQPTIARDIASAIVTNGIERGQAGYNTGSNYQSAMAVTTWMEMQNSVDIAGTNPITIPKTQYDTYVLGDIANAAKNNLGVNQAITFKLDLPIPNPIYNGVRKPLKLIKDENGMYNLKMYSDDNFTNSIQLPLDEKDPLYNYNKRLMGLGMPMADPFSLIMDTYNSIPTWLSSYVNNIDRVLGKKQ
jgi:flagellar biosynthesis/type III secretory pathway protein FliH